MARREPDEAVPQGTVSAQEAARELGLWPREFALAAELEEVRTVAVPSTWRYRVPRGEVDRLRAAGPESLRERVRVVGAVEGSRLLGISVRRFARLARGGCFCPVRFSVNRYRAVVWHYLAEEVCAVGERYGELLTGATPASLRELLATGTDFRPRRWRGRRVGQLVRAAPGPWLRAAARAAPLDEETLRAAVPDAAERERLVALRPRLVTTRSPSAAMRRATAEVTHATEGEEILWLRLLIRSDLEAARLASPLRVVAGPGAPSAVRAAGRRTYGAARTRLPREEAAAWRLTAGRRR